MDLATPCCPPCDLLVGLNQRLEIDRLGLKGLSSDFGPVGDCTRRWVTSLTAHHPAMLSYCSSSSTLSWTGGRITRYTLDSGKNQRYKCVPIVRFAF